MQNPHDQDALAVLQLLAASRRLAALPYQRLIAQRREAHAIEQELAAERRRVVTATSEDLADLHDQLWERFPAAAEQIRARVRQRNQKQGGQP